MVNLWIDGKATPGSANRTRTITNPATLEPIETVVEGDALDVRRACAAAKRAQGHWGRMPALERAKLLHGTTRCRSWHSP